MKSRIVIVFLVTLMLLPTMLAQAAPQETLYSYRVLPQPLPSAESVMETFFGEEGTKLEKIDDTHYSSTDGSYTFSWQTEYGAFAMDKPGDIARDYRIEGVPWSYANPPASTEPGKYTATEAAELGLAFLQAEMGIDVSFLQPASITPCEPDKERSHIYNIIYRYYLDGMEVTAFPGEIQIVLYVSDNGVDAVTYGRAVQFERIEEVDASTILSIDEIEYISMLQDVVPVLTYHPIPQEDGDEILVPAWRYTIGDSYSVYDAVSGEPLRATW